MATLDFKVIPSEAGEFGYLFQLCAMILSGGELTDLTVAPHLCCPKGLKLTITLVKMLAKYCSFLVLHNILFP